MPTLPALVMMNAVAVEEPTTNWFAAVPAVGLMASVANGVVVPTPRRPAMYWLPVVVAPPEMVRPVAWPPAPIVVEAEEMRPPRKYERPVEVAPVKSIAVKCEVEEAKMPLCAQRAEVVAAAMTP